MEIQPLCHVSRRRKPYIKLLTGTLTILLVFAAGRMLFGSRAGSYAALLLAFSAVHIRFSRSALASTPQTCLVLGAFCLILLLLKHEKKRGLLSVLLGIALAAAFMTHAASYIAIAPLLGVLVLTLAKRGMPVTQTIKILLLISVPLLLFLALCEVFAGLNGFSYFAELLRYAKQTNDYMARCAAPINQITRSLLLYVKYEGIIQFSFICTSLAFCAAEIFRTRRENYFILGGINLLNGLVLAALLSTGVLNLRIRWWIFLLPFFAIAGGALLARLRRPGLPRFIIPLLLVTLLIHPCALTHHLIQNTYRFAPIRRWLERNGIAQKQILLAHVFYDRESAAQTAFRIPRRKADKGVPSERKTEIHWEKLRYYTEEKGAGYLLCTARNGKACLRFGEHAALMKTIQPIKEWPGPHRFNKIPLRPDRYTAQLYDLKKIFSAIDAAEDGDAGE